MRGKQIRKPMMYVGECPVCGNSVEAFANGMLHLHLNRKDHSCEAVVNGKPQHRWAKNKMVHLIPRAEFTPDSPARISA